MEPRDDPTPPPRRQRGRKSAASVSTLSIVPDVGLRRLELPSCLSEPERALWREITAAVRPDWFRRASGYLLELYVRLLCQARDIANGITQEPVGSDHYIELVGVHRATAMASANLAVKLRLTVRSTQDRYTPRAVSTVTGPRPWEEEALPDPDPSPA